MPGKGQKQCSFCTKPCASLRQPDIFDDDRDPAHKADANLLPECQERGKSSARFVPNLAPACDSRTFLTTIVILPTRPMRTSCQNARKGAKAVLVLRQTL